MGLLKRIFGLEGNSTGNNENPIGGPFNNTSDNTSLVSGESESYFEKSLYGELLLKKNDFPYMAKVLPEEVVSNLEKQLDTILELLEITNNSTDMEIIKTIVEFESQYEENRKRADGEYTLKELQKQNKSLDETFQNMHYMHYEDFSLDSLSKYFSDRVYGLDDNTISDFVSYISKIKTKVETKDLLVGVQQSRYVNYLLKSEYRLKMLQLARLTAAITIENSNSFEISKLFDNLSITKQKMFSQFLLEDIEEEKKQIDSLNQSKEIFDQNSILQQINEIFQRLENQMKDASMIEDFTISQLFDSTRDEINNIEFFKNFVKLKIYLNTLEYQKPKLIEQINREKEEKRKKEEEERKKQEEKIKEEKKEQLRKEEEERIKQKEKAKFKNMTDEQINKKIKHLSTDLTIKGNRFLEILDFQKELANQKGLLTDEDVNRKEEMAYYYTTASEIYSLMTEANEKGIAYMVYPNSQEDKDGNFIFVTLEKNLTSIRNAINQKNSLYISSRPFNSSINWGTYDKCFCEILKDRLDSVYSNIGLYVVSKGNLYTLYSDAIVDKARKRIESEIKNLYDTYQDVADSKEYIDNILCSIKVPVTKNIVQILQIFKDNEVKPIMEPKNNVNRNEKNREFVQIYFKNDDSSKVKELILPELSKRKIEIISLTEKINLGRSIIKDQEWFEGIDK